VADFDDAICGVQAHEGPHAQSLARVAFNEGVEPWISCGFACFQPVEETGFIGERAIGHVGPEDVLLPVNRLPQRNTVMRNTHGVKPHPAAVQRAQIGRCSCWQRVYDVAYGSVGHVISHIQFASVCTTSYLPTMTTLHDAGQAALTALPANRRILGLDLGTKTIGLATADVEGQIATPRETIARAKFTADAKLLLDFAARENIGLMVLGLPFNMDGTEGPRAQASRAFVRNLSKLTDIPVVFWDERLSTVAVTRVMLDADMSRAKRAENVDKLAAAYILQSFLDACA
jgi:putative holliday junction resolvase